MEQGLHLLHARGRGRARRSARHASTVAGSSSTWSTCRSSARSRRSSSASSPTGTSPSAASATRSQITYVTPLDGAFTKPVASQHARRDARREGHRARHRVQHRRGRRRRRPAHRLRRPRGRRSTWPSSSRCTAAPSTSAARPGSATSSTSCPPTSTRCSRRPQPNVFVIGDAANVPASKAGSVTHFEGETLVENVRRFLAGEPLERGFDGHANCFIETGFHKALLIDFNYDTEPLPGHYPGRGRPAAAEGIAAQPPRQADVPVVLLARPAPRPRHPRHRLDHAHRRQATRDATSQED